MRNLKEMVEQGAMMGLAHLEAQGDPRGIVDVIVRDTYVTEDETTVIDEYRVELCQDARGSWFVESVDIVQTKQRGDWEHEA